MSILLASHVLISIALLVSGVAKIPARTGTQDAMTSLRLPARAAHPLIARVLPWLEIALALLVWIPVVPWQVVLAVLTLTLMLAYLVIIARALRFDETVECSCFGTLASPTVSTATLARNTLLVTLAAIAVASAATGVTARMLLTSPLLVITTVLALVVAIWLTVLVLGGVRSADTAPAHTGQAGAAGYPGAVGQAGATSPSGAVDNNASASDPDAEELDYLRQPIPYALVEYADGRTTSLRTLTQQRPALLLLVSPGCGPCERVISHIAQWQAEIGSVVQILTLIRRSREAMDDPALRDDRFAGTVVRDPEGNVAEVFSSPGVPTAILLGADGLTAGGPVTGGDDVVGFVGEIREQLTGLLQEYPAESDAAQAGVPGTDADEPDPAEVSTLGSSQH